MNYDAAGNLLNSTLGNGVVQTFNHANPRLQERGITATLNGTTLKHFTYDYGTSSTNTDRVLLTVNVRFQPS